MKRTIAILILLFTVSIFAQEKPNVENPEKAKIQKDFTELQKQSNDLKAQIYDAQEFIVKAKVQIEDFTKKMLELQQKFQAIIEAEKKEVKSEKK